jgi:hypothetical protein
MGGYNHVSSIMLQTGSKINCSYCTGFFWSNTNSGIRCLNYPFSISFIPSLNTKIAAFFYLLFLSETVQICAAISVHFLGVFSSPRLPRFNIFKPLIFNRKLGILLKSYLLGNAAMGIYIPIAALP